MKIVIFAGGTGRRLWPISRQSLPKQFEAIVAEKSTVQLAYDRLRSGFDAHDIFVSTNSRYLTILKAQLPDLPGENFIGEPARRDLAAAVGLSVTHLAKKFPRSESFAIVWGDNYMTNTETYLQMLKSADNIVKADRAKIVFIGETPRFANNNLGWIGIGEELGSEAQKQFFEFSSWHYRPPLDLCKQMYSSGEYVWNTGYFVTTIGFVADAYNELQPEMWSALSQIGETLSTMKYQQTLDDIYPRLPVESFDEAIVQYIPREEAVVMFGNMGWSDPGTLYALKESINSDTSVNVVRGLVKAHMTSDSLLYNYEDKKLLAAVGLEGMIVINTEDAILVVHKDQIALVKELVNELVGSELEKFA